MSKISSMSKNRMSKNWFITGASSGFGRILAERLLARGDGVTATLRRPGALDDLQARYGDRLRVALLDVTDMAAIRTVLAEAFGSGRIDIVVNNAGYGLFGAAEELTSDQIRRQIDTNLIGSIEVIRAALPHLRAQGGGRIVQLSSEGGQIAYPGFSLYHATKWGIEGFVEAVAKEAAPFGIDFLLVEPGPTRTNFAAGLVQAEPMAVYADTPVGTLRRGFFDGSFAIRGDVERCVGAMIAAADAKKPALRLALGSTAYVSIREALSARLRAIEAQRQIAHSGDRLG